MLGSINQPSETPLAIYSAILLRRTGNLSAARSQFNYKIRTERTKTFLLLLSVRLSHFSRLIHEASGERIALFGKINPAELPKQTPVASFWSKLQLISEVRVAHARE